MTPEAAAARTKFYLGKLNMKSPTKQVVNIIVNVLAEGLIICFSGILLCALALSFSERLVFAYHHIGTTDVHTIFTTPFYTITFLVLGWFGS